MMALILECKILQRKITTYEQSLSRGLVESMGVIGPGEFLPERQALNILEFYNSIFLNSEIATDCNLIETTVQFV